MKKIFAILMILISFAGLGFAKGKSDVSEQVVGYINWYGNEPFAYPGFVTVDGKIYSLAVEEGSAFAVKDISALQGNMIQLEGRVDRLRIGGFEVLKDGVFIVKSYKSLTN